VVRWPLLAGLMLVGLAMLYRYAPDRDGARFRWLSWGSLLATALWLAGSGLFSLYVNSFANYNRTYGVLGAVIVLLIWLFLTSFVVLLGAELNRELELRAKQAGAAAAPARTEEGDGRAAGGVPVSPPSGQQR
jgi:membrane protein